MSKTPKGDDPRLESIGCPVHGDDVTCKVKYITEGGVHTLVDFECNMEGMCGIPSWDPCPLYVAYLEGKTQKPRR